MHPIVRLNVGPRRTRSKGTVEHKDTRAEHNDALIAPPTLSYRRSRVEREMARLARLQRAVPQSDARPKVGATHLLRQRYDLGFFDEETTRLEPIPNPFEAKVLPMCPE